MRCYVLSIWHVWGGGLVSRRRGFRLENDEDLTLLKSSLGECYIISCKAWIH